LFKIRYVLEDDQPFWFSLDHHISEAELALKVRDRRGYVISDDDRPVGIMRYNLFWDTIPFLTMIHFVQAHQRKGFGKAAMLHWEAEMGGLGHRMVMTSTQVDEQAQHFYRKLGYVDRGSLFLDHTPMDQPQEMLMVKLL
jgi:ribosomal protein S18 acetylase RimI-like enzyme